jgi:D-3-phosphoglycerate dehydrogenase
MTRFKILISDPLHPEAVQWLEAQPDVELTARPEIGRGELRGVISEFDAIIVRSRSKLDAELIAQDGRLKVIGRAGTGLDNIDVCAARQSGIAVLNSPGANANAVAELTLALILALARHLPSAFIARKKPKEYGWELQEKALGIVGLGQIGGRVAQLAHAFGMRLLGYDIVLEAGPQGIAIERVDLKRLLGESDVITLHVPLTAETRGLIGADALDEMREGAWLVNTARAEIVDEEALIEALDSGRVAGYAADVCGDERLWDHPRAVITPHIGAQTEEAQQRAGLWIARRVLSALRETAGG